MGLFDGYLDPEQFRASGGLLGRLLSLPQMHGLHQPSMDFDPRVSANPQTLVYRPTLDIPTNDDQMPQFGRADVSQAMPPAPDAGDRLSVGFQNWAHTPVGNQVAGGANDFTGPSSGQRTDAGGNTSDADSSGNGWAGGSVEVSSLAGEQSPGLSKIGYFEIPTNPNQAFGELLGIQERNEKDTISKNDHVSGVREGNIRRKEDGSLEVTNGTVVTLSYKDGRARTITVTGDDIAYIDATTGEVVVQKSF